LFFEEWFVASASVMNTYARLPVAFVSGAGARLTDEDGQSYLDALSGIAVCGLGHAHPVVAEAIAEQARTLIHTSNLYRVPLQEQLAERLCALTGMKQAFFGNSGAEANEAAIKLARLYGHRKGVTNPTIVVMEGAFHGRTMATLTATGNRKVQAGFEPLVPGFVRAPFGDLAAVESIAEHQSNVVAVFVEPIQGEGGIVVPPADYLPGLRALCDAKGWLLMLDEVQSGAGRTGRLFAHEHAGILPDVLTTAKGIANGFPIGAALTGGAAHEVLGPGTHGSTFGGNPLACAAALATLSVLTNGDTLPRVAALGDRMQSRFKQALAGDNRVREVRGHGLMLGIELAEAPERFVERALEARLLLNVTQGKVIRLLPPFILTDAEADHIVDQVVELIRS
jgi:acetylornithine aminotransferase